VRLLWSWPVGLVSTVPPTLYSFLPRKRALAAFATNTREKTTIRKIIENHENP
jgi:hypothetical protein